MKILERRPVGSRGKTPIPIRIGPPLRGTPRGGRIITTPSSANGMIIDVGGVNRKSLVISPKIKTQIENEEESVSAIQSFINETSSPIKTPSPSVRITSTATGVVNIKAVSDITTPTSQVIRSVPASTPRGRGRPPKNQQSLMTLSADSVVGSVRNMKGVSMVTLTAGGIIKKVTPSLKRKRPELDSDDEGDSDDLYDEDDEDDEDEMANSGLSQNNAAAEENGKKKNSEDREYRPPRKLDPEDSLNSTSGSLNESDLNRSKRQRKEKKIFDL